MSVPLVIIQELMEVMKEVKEMLGARVHHVTPASAGPDAPHAWVWSNHPIKHGASIDDAEFKKLEKQKRTKTFKMFIIDRGDFKMGRVGEVFLSGQDMRSRFTDLHYRILVYALRNHHVPGSREIAQFAKHCWLEGEAVVADLASKKAMVSGDGENKYRRVIMHVNNILEAECSVVLEKAPKGEYSLSGHVPFVVIELPVQ